MTETRSPFFRPLARSARTTTAMIPAGVLLGIAWAASLLIRYRVEITVIMTIATAVVAASLATRSGGRAARVLAVAAGTLGVCGGTVWVFTAYYPGWLMAQFNAFALVGLSAIEVWRLRAVELASIRQRLGRWVGVGGTALSLLVSAFLFAFSFTATPFAITVQMASGAGNSFDPPAPPTSTVVSGARVISNIRYGTSHPNSFLDIYIADDDATVSRPTYVIVHGGGFVAGSKNDGDPNASGSYFALGAGPMLKAGYNLVTINYGLAPQFPYPTPVVQLGEAIQFLNQRGAAYGLDMSRVVLSGGSAGGHIVAQYAAIQTDPAYARLVGIKPSMASSTLKAVELDSAAIDPGRAGATQEARLALDLLFDLSLRAYLGTSRQRYEEANIINHVTERYPPTFIADGNVGTFTDQARDLARKLTVLRVPNHLTLFKVSQAELVHGFMAQPSPWTDEYNRQKIAFLRDYAL